MNGRNNGSLHLILFVIACVLLFFAAFPWHPLVEPHRARLGWAGMFFWAVSSFF